MHKEEPGTETITWEIPVPLLTSRFFLYDMLKVVVIMFLIVGGILGGILAFEGDWGQWAGVLKINGIIALGFVGMYVLVSLLWFGNRCETRFSVSRKGISAEMTRRREKVVNRALAVLGIMTGNPRVAGTGLIAMSRESVGIGWDLVCRVKEHPLLRVITIMDNWHVLLRLHCTPENYAQVAEAVRAHAGEGRRRREKGEAGASASQAPRLLRLSGLAFLASLMLLSVPYPFKVKPFFAAVSFSAVLLALWMPALKRFFGVISLVWVLLIGYFVTTDGFRTMSRHGFQTMSAGDWLRLALAAAGMAILGTLAMRVLFGNSRERRTGRGDGNSK